MITLLFTEGQCNIMGEKVIRKCFVLYSARHRYIRKKSYNTSGPRHCVGMFFKSLVAPLILQKQNWDFVLQAMPLNQRRDAAALFVFIHCGEHFRLGICIPCYTMLNKYFTVQQHLFTMFNLHNYFITLTHLHTCAVSVPFWILWRCLCGDILCCSKRSERFPESGPFLSERRRALFYNNNQPDDNAAAAAAQLCSESIMCLCVLNNFL